PCARNRSRPRPSTRSTHARDTSGRSSVRRVPGTPSAANADGTTRARCAYSGAVAIPSNLVAAAKRHQPRTPHSSCPWELADHTLGDGLRLVTGFVGIRIAAVVLVLHRDELGTVIVEFAVCPAHLAGV